MGKVYRARDSRLRRQVALKILPAAFAIDPDRRRRFTQEAQAAAALNHPNILAVHDIGVENGTPFLITELVDGQELRKELERGALPVKRLLDLAVQISAGLRGAHEAGLVHRDLKPENVMVTRDGRVKILDFGLATSAQPVGDAVDGPQTTRTVSGLIVGTAGYMSPEQARGGAVDFRSDLFSFGVMLYEMATGVHPFRRNSGVETMAAIIADEPLPIAEQNSRIPTILRWIIERCLAKDPGDRYAATADLAFDLTALRGRLAEAEAGTSPEKPVRRRWWPAIAAGLGLIVVGSIVLAGRATREPTSLYTFTPLVTDAGYQGAPAWSPDGKTIAYVAQVDGVLQVFTRNVTSSLPLKITDRPFDSEDPFWSADGTRIFFHSLAEDQESLWSVSAGGGPPQVVVKNASRAALSPDGKTLALMRHQTGGFGSLRLWMASPPEAEPQPYAEPPFNTYLFSDGWLRFSQDGKNLCVWGYGFGRRGASGVIASAYWLLPMPTGRPREVLNSLVLQSPSGANVFDWMPDNRHLTIGLAHPRLMGRHLWLADTESGRHEPLTATPGNESYPAVSPDGGRIAFASEAVDFDLVTLPVDGTAMQPLLATSRNEFDPAWSPRGAQYAFATDRNGSMQISLRSQDGEWERAIVSEDQFKGERTLTLGAIAFAPDGERIVYQRLGERTGYRLWISTAAAAGPPVQVHTGTTYQDAPTWSPDGVWLAFVEGVQGLNHLVKKRVGGPDALVTLLRDRVTPLSRPEWSPDGQWILCDTADGLMLVRSDGKTSRLLSEEFWLTYAWSGDGRSVMGLREGDKRRHLALVAVDVATGAERVINPDLGAIPPANQPVRGFARMPDGRFVTSIARARSDIWVMDGVRAPSSWLARWLSLWQR